jgi:glucosamine--fructose-6-phosphate aminotransferase (isomerizing)
MTISHTRAPALVAERIKHPFLTYDMICEIPEAIQRTIETSSSQLHSIAERLNGRSNFYFTGCGTAFFSAMLGSNILSLTGMDGLNFECVQALELTNYHPIAANSATFGVSHSGITKTTLDAMRTAKSRRSYTVGVTHFAQSPISDVAEDIVVVGNGPDKSRCHTKCYLAGALPLVMVGIQLLGQRRATQRERLQEIQMELIQLPELAKKVLASTEPLMKGLVEKTAGKRTFYFAGTGASYPNALEAALKLMETSYLPAQGFETEQFLHGPWVSLDSESVLFVMATDEPTHGRSLDLVKAATRLGSTVVPLVHEGDQEIGSICKNTFQLPPVDEQVAPYLSIIPLYLFAYYMCLQRGYNPDYLRYLTPAYWDARTIVFPPGTH